MYKVSIYIYLYTAHKFKAFLGNILKSFCRIGILYRIATHLTSNVFVCMLLMYRVHLLYTNNLSRQIVVYYIFVCMAVYLFPYRNLYIYDIIQLTIQVQEIVNLKWRFSLYLHVFLSGIYYVPKIYTILSGIYFCILKNVYLGQ